MAAVAEQAAVPSSDDQFIRHHSPEPPAETEYQRDVRHLVKLLSQLNPSAKEFFPSRAATASGGQKNDGQLSAVAPVYVVPGYRRNNGAISTDGSNESGSDGSPNNQANRKKRNGWRRMNSRVRKAQSEESIKRTVYISDIDQSVTEESLAEVFAYCGQVVDCRVCGDPNSVLRFAFIEFSDEVGAKAALSLEGTMLGFYPVRVLPSKTAILPVNPKFLPKSEDEKEMVIRTVYCTNIDKKVTQREVKVFFEQFCGEVSRLRILGDNMHSTRIAFVEFLQAESAIGALNCTGMILGTQQIRVSPSKTPVRLRAPRAALK